MSFHQEAPGLSRRRTLHYLTSIGQLQFLVAEEIKKKNMIPEKLTCHAYMTSFQANDKRTWFCVCFDFVQGHPTRI